MKRRKKLSVYRIDATHKVMTTRPLTAIELKELTAIIRKSRPPIP